MKTSIYLKSCVLASAAVTSVCVAAINPVGRPLKFYEVTPARIVSFFMPGVNCSISTPVVGCVSLDANGTATFANIEIVSATVSASSGRSTLCAAPNGSVTYAFNRRAPAGTDLSTIRLSYRFEIVSSVLNDPALIDARTGLPFNGKLAFQDVSAFVDQDYMGPSQRVVRSQKIASFDCATPIVNYTTLLARGLSSTDAQRVMSQSMTVRLYLSGGLIQADSGAHSLSLRFMGD